ncbi:MAG TPA: carbohydrate ABC transporter permease [Candidatus Ozemobacteraceae bacterium]|nr:carbohydrate ABC transporter permease [Candidatus Ozemobacteraceae bacterium]
MKHLMKNPFHLVIHFFLILGSIFMLFPFLWMIFTSFKNEDEILKTGKQIILLPDSMRPGFLNDDKARERLAEQEKLEAAWVAAHSQAEVASSSQPLNKLKKPFHFWDNYREALAAQPFYRYFLNTVFVSISITAGSLFLASLAAYAFAFFTFPFKDLLFTLMLGTLMIPQQALLIPNYIILSKMGWINTFAAMIVPWLASAYSVFFLRQFFLQLPKDLYDAAVIDGCSKFQFYYKILLPLAKPPMVTLGIFSFLGTWNSFVWPLIVTNDTSLRVIQVGLSYFSSEAGTRWGPLMAASTMTIVPLVIMYFIAQRQFVESQAMSGMKE